MALANLFKLEKLKILVFGDADRTGPAKATFEVMFNPASYAESHENVFQSFQGINTSGRQARYSHSRSKNLSLKLVFDGTGVSDYGLVRLTPWATPPVEEQVARFLRLCFHMDGELHEPKYLRVTWGKLDLKCRLKTAEITYTLFDRSGAPLRAELAAVFVEDVPAAERVRLENKSSPDLTHTRVVKAGDTLPALTREIYGTSAPYLRVAQANGLDDFRDLRPGQVLQFPPLEP